MNSIFQNLNLSRLAMWWLPTFLRKSFLTQIISIFVRPLDKMYVDFLKSREQNLIRLNHNYQKFSIQKRLNDRFDTILRRIKIVNAVEYQGVYLYTEAEDDNLHSKTKWLKSNDPIYLRTDAELTSEYDFIVEIPNSNINQIQLAAEVDYYKLIGKNYKIVIV